MKKFYTLVSVDGDDNAGYTVTLDGRPVKTSGRWDLTAPTRALADAITAEWAAQDEDILPDTMPLTQILSTALDMDDAQRADIDARLKAYLDTDLVCYRTDAPPELAQAQEQAWDPFLEGFEKKHGAALETTTGLAALTQPQAAHNAVHKALEALDHYKFTAFQVSVSATGSLVMGLALLDGSARPDDIYEAALVDELYKAELYNEDKYGAAPQAEKQRDALRRDLTAARKFLDLL